MISSQTLVFLLIGASILLILVIAIRPSISASREGKIIAFLALFIVTHYAAGGGSGWRIRAHGTLGADTMSTSSNRPSF
jgi:hypothetical protein